VLNFFSHKKIIKNTQKKEGTEAWYSMRAPLGHAGGGRSTPFLVGKYQEDDAYVIVLYM
jgi:hypothetical protein